MKLHVHDYMIILPKILALAFSLLALRRQATVMENSI